MINIFYFFFCRRIFVGHDSVWGTLIHTLMMACISIYMHVRLKKTKAASQDSLTCMWLLPDYIHTLYTVTPNNIYDVSPALACFNANPPTKSDGQELHHFLPSAILQPCLKLLVFPHLIVFSQEAVVNCLFLCLDYGSVRSFLLFQSEKLLYSHFARMLQNSPLTFTTVTSNIGLTVTENDHTHAQRHTH